MKNLYLTVLLLTSSQLIFAGGEHVHEVKEKTHTQKQARATKVTDQFSIYGDDWPNILTKEISVAQAINNSLNDPKNEKQLIVGDITQVCQKMGCWMILTTDENFARVDFKNHSFLIPKDSRGSAQVYGVLKEVILSAEQKQHYESEGAELPSKKMFEIAADSVKIFTE